MIKYFKRIKNLFGVAIPGALVLVTDVQTSGNALLYNDDGSPLSNPVTSDDNGMIQFNIKTGVFNLAFSSADLGVTINQVSIAEIENLLYLINDDADTITENTIVYVSGDGQVKKAVNNGTLEQASAEMICLETLTNGSTGKFQKASTISLPGTSGEIGYLGDDGDIVNTPPIVADANYHTILGYWCSDTEFILNIRKPFRISYDI